MLAINHRYDNSAQDMQALAYRLDLPGYALCLHEQWLGELSPAGKPPALGQPLYTVVDKVAG